VVFGQVNISSQWVLLAMAATHILYMEKEMTKVATQSYVQTSLQLKCK
jgi:hypothetical protein